MPCLPRIKSVTLHYLTSHDVHLLAFLRAVGLREFVMAAVWNRASHYIFALWFLFLSFFLLSVFFPCLISAIPDWMSTILAHMTWP